MKETRILIRLLALVTALVSFAGYASAQPQTVQIAGAPCTPPPILHCPDKDCPGERVINPGLVVEMKTRRTYFLDYPCDLKPGEKVTFILSLHGGGSYGNWQRHYFPIMDYKDKYRLVIATPNSPTRVWSDADDEYLHNIVNFVIEQIGRDGKNHSHSNQQEKGKDQRNRQDGSVKIAGYVLIRQSHACNRNAHSKVGSYMQDMTGTAENRLSRKVVGRSVDGFSQKPSIEYEIAPPSNGSIIEQNRVTRFNAPAQEPPIAYCVGQD